MYPKNYVLYTGKTLEILYKVTLYKIINFNKIKIKYF